MQAIKARGTGLPECHPGLDHVADRKRYSGPGFPIQNENSRMVPANEPRFYRGRSAKPVPFYLDLASCSLLPTEAARTVAKAPIAARVTRDTARVTEGHG